MRIVLKIAGVILMVGSVQAASVGNVGGVVHDAATRSPLFGASVMVKGTELGAAADADG